MSMRVNRKHNYNHLLRTILSRHVFHWHVMTCRCVSGRSKLLTRQAVLTTRAYVKTNVLEQRRQDEYEQGVTFESVHL